MLHCVDAHCVPTDSAEEALIFELKSVDAIPDIHQAQLLTYMKLAGIKTGLPINFNVSRLKVGVRRFVIVL